MNNEMKKIAILSSGRAPFASGLVPLFNEGNRVRTVLALSDKDNAPFLQEMLSEGVESLYFPEVVWNASPNDILEVLRAREVDMIIVDGFYSLIPKTIIDAYPSQILSILPSLSPADSVGCKDIVEVQRRVISDGASLAGAVVCRVDDPDGTGRVVDKAECEAGTDPVALARRVSQLASSLLPKVIVNVSRETNASIPEDIKVTPSPDRRWAEALKMEYDPSKIQQPASPSAPFGRAPVTPLSSGGVPGSPLSSSGGVPGSSAENNGDERPPMPKSYIVWSVLVTVLCCFIPGILAIIFSSQVTSKYYAGDYEGSARASRNAEIWIIVSFVLGVLSSTLYLPFMFISGSIFS